MVNPAIMLPHQSYKPLFLLLITFIKLSVSAQPYSHTDSIEIYQWLDKADQETTTGSYQVARKHVQQALTLSKEKKMLRAQGFSELKLADILVQQQDYKNVPDLYTSVFQIGRQLKDTFLLALCTYQQGQYHMYNDQLDDADQLFSRALALKFEKDQSAYTASIYNDIGYIHGLRNDLEKEAFWYLKALRLQEKVEDLAGMAITTNNIANVYLNLGDKDKAFSFARESIAMREKIGNPQGLSTSYENISRMFWDVSLDSASKYQQLASKYAEKTGIPNLIMRSYDNLSVLMDKRRNKPEALAYIEKSIALCRQTNDKAGLATKLRWAAILSGDLKDTATMEKYFNEAHELAVAVGNKKLLRDVYATRASAYRKLNDYKNAYQNMEKSYAYRDSITKDETAVNIAELQAKYDTEQKDNEIARLTTQQRIRQLELEKQQAIIAGNKLEAQQKENEIKLLSQQQQLSDTRLKQQAEELEKQVLLARNNEQQLQLVAQEKELQARQIENQRMIRNVLIGGVCLLLVLGWVLFNRYQLKRKIQQQQELLTMRSVIAKDLHDEIGSTLTSIKILSQVSKNNLQKDQQKASSLLEKITEQSAQMQQGMSDIVWSIKPDNDKLENMLVRMREYAAHTLESKNVATKFSVEEETLGLTLDMQQRKDFFLIFKEAINNAAKYSDATEVDVQLTRQDGYLLLSIIDNGVGFSRKEVTSSNGLTNMQSRAASLQGSVEINSSPGMGTKVMVRVPAT